jgi:hypothetical protein
MRLWSSSGRSRNSNLTFIAFSESLRSFGSPSRMSSRKRGRTSTSEFGQMRRLDHHYINRLLKLKALKPASRALSLNFKCTYLRIRTCTGETTQKATHAWACVGDLGASNFGTPLCEYHVSKVSGMQISSDFENVRQKPLSRRIRKML